MSQLYGHLYKTRLANSGINKVPIDPLLSTGMSLSTKNIISLNVSHRVKSEIYDH